ncbi:MAG: glycosyltransferase family 39 protein [Candidatus Korobacteraceae bacterium]|jgi:hypothetical protein
MTRAAKLLLVPLLALQVAFFTFVALHRFVDGDEGFYLLASRLVLMHKRPYLDFFYTQAPLLPYVYALWMRFAGVTWISAKLFSALLTALLGTLLYEHVCEQTRNWVAGLSAVVIFASSTLVFAWYPVVKTFSLAGLFLFAAYVVLTRFSAASPRWLIAAGGVLYGLSVDARSYLLLLTPVFLLWIFNNSDTRNKLASILWFLGGFTAGIAPCLFLFLPSPDAFLFDNLRYHAIRSSAGLLGWWGEKLVIALQVFLGGPEGNGLQWSILFFVSLGFVFSIQRRRYPPRLAFQIAVVLAIISFLPTPVHPQYLCLCIPFLLVSAVCVVHAFFAELESRHAKLIAVAACVSLLGIYLAASVRDFRRYLITGDGVPGVKAGDPDDWKLQRVIEVSRAIDQIARPGEEVASFWPGDIFQTNAVPLPGFENDFATPVADKLSSQQRTRYHIISPTEIESNFAAHRPRVAMLRNHILAAATKGDLNGLRMAEGFRRSLLADGYTVVRAVGETSIYVCCSKP